jgi:pilus assembly protein Flp/PilA
MHRLTSPIVRFLRSEAGPTAVEYAVMLALIIVVCVAAISSIGQNIDETAEMVSPPLQVGSS